MAQNVVGMKFASVFIQMGLERMKGWTIIELLTVLVAVGVLSMLSINSFVRAKHLTAFSAAEVTARQFFTAFEAGVVQTAENFGAVNLNNINLTSQQDINSNQIINSLLLGFSLPSNLQVTMSVDLGCIRSATCVQLNAVFDHSNACKVLISERYGNGDEVTTSLPKPGC